ncbi:MAG: hypothetical protein JXQ82_07855 [Methanomicrobiaceae archaeon]|nr:hypothetical protein [Methanomicrobiaceae archaeon]
MSEVAQQPVVIPSTANADELAQMDMLLALDRVQHSQDAESAAVFVERALATGIAHYPLGEVIRAIEQRLPEATPQQEESLSLLKDKGSGTVSPARVIGAFGDTALVLVKKQGLINPYKVIEFTVPKDFENGIPGWDITRPLQRRIWAPAEEVSSNV